MSYTKTFLKKGSQLSLSLALGLGMIGSHFTVAKADTSLVVNNSINQTPEALVQSLVGGDVTVSNVKYTGAPKALGSFTGGQGIFGIEKGVVLSTGDVKGIVGPNTSDNFTGENNTNGDTELNGLIPGYETTDASVLDFDFVSKTGMISFKYVFSSEEYREYVDTQYNDVFGFFLNGKNIAFIPDSTTPVAINTINNGNGSPGSEGSYSQYYIDNSISSGAPYNTEMDGMTVVMTAVAKVEPGVVNHIKLAIADVGDMSLDSNVLLESGSFTDSTENVSISSVIPDFTGNTETVGEVIVPDGTTLPVENTETSTTQDSASTEMPPTIDPATSTDAVTTGNSESEDVQTEPSTTTSNPVEVSPVPVQANPAPDLLSFDKITGGGKISPHKKSSTNASFGFNVINVRGNVNVNLEYNDNSQGKSKNGAVKQLHVNGYAFNVKQIKDAKGNVIGIEFDAPAVLNSNDNVKVHVQVVDTGKASLDVFQLTITDGNNDVKGYTSGDGAVEAGNIQIH